MKLEQNFASKLKHYIEFLNPSTTREEEWDIVSCCFAEIKSITDTNVREFDDISFGHLLSQEYFIITCRYIKDLHRRMRIKFGDRYFAITRITNPYEMNIVIKIIALEITE